MRKSVTGDLEAASPWHDTVTRWSWSFSLWQGDHGASPWLSTLLQRHDHQHFPSKLGKIFMDSEEMCMCVCADHLLTFFFFPSVQLGLHRWNIFREAGADGWSADDDDDGGGGTQKIKSRKLKALRLQSQYPINIAEGGFEHLVITISNGIHHKPIHLSWALFNLICSFFLKNLQRLKIRFQCSALKDIFVFTFCFHFFFFFLKVYLVGICNFSYSSFILLFFSPSI